MFELIKSNRVSISCEKGVSYFKGFSCSNSVPFKVTSTAVSFIVQNNGKTFQMKIKSLTEREKIAYQNKQIENNLTENEIDIKQMIPSHNGKLEVDSENILSKQVSTLEEKVKSEKSKLLDTEDLDFLTHFSLLRFPNFLNTEINESSILYKFREEQSIQNMYDFVVIDDFKILILEHFENGSLREFLKVQASLPFDKKFLKNEEDNMKFLSKIIHSINILNKSGYVHNNLSPDSIYIDENNSPVIADFDFVKEINSISFVNSLFFSNNEDLIIQTNDGNSKIYKTKRDFGFMSPEIILASTDKMLLYSSKIDSYSIGAIFYYMLYNKNPFKGNSTNEILESLKSRHVFIPNGTTINSMRLLVKTLSLDPSIRLTIFQLQFTIDHELKFGFDYRIKEDLQLSTDILYTSWYGRSFFDKYSEMIFVLIMAFIVIPSTVFLASYKFKQNQRNLNRNTNNLNQEQVEIQDNIDPNQNDNNQGNQNNPLNANNANLQIALGNNLL